MLVVIVLSGIALIAVSIMKLFCNFDVTGNPLTFLSIVCAILGVQFFAIGLIGELSVIIYYSRGEKKSFQVRELVNFETLVTDKRASKGLELEKTEHSA